MDEYSCVVTRLWVSAETVRVSFGFQTTISASDPTAMRPEHTDRYIDLLCNTYIIVYSHDMAWNLLRWMFKYWSMFYIKVTVQLPSVRNCCDTFAWVNVEEFSSVGARYSDKLILIHLPRRLQRDPMTKIKTEINVRNKMAESPHVKFILFFQIYITYIYIHFYSQVHPLLLEPRFKWRKTPQ